MPHICLLLVDDDQLILATLAKSLRNEGYSVETADSGDGALRIANSSSIDLAIVDIRMPGMLGTELAKQLRELHGIATLFLSAYSDKTFVEESVKEGGVGYVVKPVDTAQLIPAIETGLARARDLYALLGAKGQLEKALTGSRQISIAVGILMVRRELNKEAAFELLRNAARKNQQNLDDYSRELVLATERLNDILSTLG